MLTIRRDDLSGPEIRALLEEHLRSMYELSPPESVHAFDVRKLQQPDVTWSVCGCAYHRGGAAALLRSAEPGDRVDAGFQAGAEAV